MPGPRSGCRSTRDGILGPDRSYVLSLPDCPLAPIGAIGAPSKTRAPMDDKGAYGEAGGAK